MVKSKAKRLAELADIPPDQPSQFSNAQCKRKEIAQGPLPITEKRALLSPAKMVTATPATPEGDRTTEILQPLRGVVGRLDKLERSQVKLEQPLETPTKD
ncbi:uncharacterized protein PITG_07520 [Phytophthora infestans T30-4]|uniref:Uncharacterized protein n=1 Tax=Phytophthora infestans (strain T30-4) TaxID=403677 RepID=D0N8J5_PHYIT|nr:uncharacterized protein PITG_07520 [Phytophthora infestans T30-4]EEY53880.1 conserved hypothetical protein [Phytophthora infestans T30-4]|eukprot:XP_002904511.1 conserved hypothetical protein [Phytophthora infestans T30-4]